MVVIGKSKFSDIPMDHRVFQFATRGQCIKGKKLDCFEHNHIFCFNCNVLALLSFYALPSGGNQKTRWSIRAGVFYKIGYFLFRSNLPSLFASKDIVANFTSLTESLFEK